MTTAAASCVYHPLGICMQHAQPAAGQPLFGIGDFLTAIAVFAVAYTMADERYKFRLAVSAIPIHTIFFAATILTGIGLIALPFWFELGLPIPSLLNDQKIFEAFFAAVVIGLIALWTFVAFISPPEVLPAKCVSICSESFFKQSPTVRSPSFRRSHMNWDVLQSR
ncbi:hypothetical protein HB775_05850 [Rhizobium leguminosarum bv. trifolii]|nr:hypothetical protein HB775_05850 [Rhizobium leguminosarum bv. trifolii]